MTPAALADQLDLAADHLRRARTLAILTGAGVSAESGVPTFRDADGLWEGHPVEEVATPEAFAKNPELVWRFYHLRRDNLRAVAPNPGHFALAELERRFTPERCATITQNVDGLHARAGTTRLYELHGSLQCVRCPACGYRANVGLDPLPPLPTCPICEALVRPDIVWFTEELDPELWPTARKAVEACDCLLVAGTSAQVYPAAGLILLARQGRRSVIEVNPKPTPASAVADVCVAGPAGVVLPRLVEMTA